jgi:mannose-6-phosphate isomerase
MFVGLINTPRDYAWGSATAIAELLGRTPSGEPEAEYWLGTHPGSPSRLIDGPGGAKTLDEIANLPFIVKVLAAETSLSLQAHPSTELAEEGFARENALGIPLDDPRRNYKDPLHKPELIYAINDGFEALCGFRPVAATRDLLGALGHDPLVEKLIDRLVDDSSLPGVFEWLMSDGDGVRDLRERVLELAPNAPAPEFATVLKLASQFPGDVGILVSLLLNLVTLRAGEVIYLPAGNIHAYQHGLGIEVLAASDNVLRGGLTPKHVDVAELVKVVDFRPLPVPYLRPEPTEPGLALFRPDVPDFELAVITPADAPGGSVQFSPTGEFVALCTGGAVSIRGTTTLKDLARGDAVFGTGGESPLTVSGDGKLFLASRNPTVVPASDASA